MDPEFLAQRLGRCEAWKEHLHHRRAVRASTLAKKVCGRGPESLGRFGTQRSTTWKIWKIFFFGTASITNNDGIIIFSGSNSARKPFAIWIYIIPSWNSTPTETGGMYWACSFWPYDHMALAKNGISQFRYQSNHHIPMFSWPRGVYVSHGCDAKSRWTFPQRIRASARSFGPTPAFRPSGLAALPGTSSCSLGMLLGYFGMLSWDVKLGY